jgi:hypothetical protein
MRRPHNAAGYPLSGTTWVDRPGANKRFPEIAVPLELHSTFDIAADTNQAIWCDVFVPKSMPVGTYRGTVLVSGVSVPVQLEVLPITLPDVPTCKTMLPVQCGGDVGFRHYGIAHPNPGSPEHTKARQLGDRYVQLVHRHKVAPLTGEPGTMYVAPEKMREHILPVLDGSLFTPEHGYDGIGTGTGTGIYAIALYGGWPWKAGCTQEIMQRNCRAWADWFAANSPATEKFLFLIDESNDIPQIEQWSQWMDGTGVPSMATVPMRKWAACPSLDLPTSSPQFCVPAEAFATIESLRQAGKQLWCYNGFRPQGGSIATEDDGVAFRVQSWAQFKHRINRWFWWESTYWNNYQGGQGQTDLFQRAQTFGGRSQTADPSRGETGWNYTNGDGVLLYPGTDRVYSDSSYGVDGPIASLRLKHWRRGVQDHDYLTMARAVNPVATDAIVSRIVPEVEWEVGCSDPTDPTWKRCDISWSTSPDVWELARRELATIIASEQPTPIEQARAELNAAQAGISRALLLLEDEPIEVHV